MWRENLSYFIEKHDLWSRYEPENRGVLIAYASMYGNTEEAAQALASRLYERGVKDVVVRDVSNTHVSTLIADAFRLSHIVLASVTYNLGIYPVMHSFISDMKALNLQNRTVALIENGTWAIKSGELMAKELEGMKNMTVLPDKLTLTSSLPAARAADLDAFADALTASIKA